MTHATLRNGLVVGQLTVTFVLLAAAGLLAHAFIRLHQHDPGFQSDRLLTVGFELSPRLSAGTGASEAFLSELRRRAGAIPGVLDATVSGTVPPNLMYRSVRIETRDRGVVTGSEVIVSEAHIDDGFFATLGMPLVSGRTVDDRDVRDSPRVSVISATLARQIWPDASALGQLFRMSPNSPWLTVVGVVADVTNGGFENPLGKLAIYSPRAQSDAPFFVSLIVRLAAASVPVVEQIRQLIRDLDRDVPVVEVATADEVIAAANAKARFATMLMIGSSAMALLLGLSGVYGASWYAVRQRRQEIGVRVALGAAPGDILRMVLATSARLVLISIPLGLAGAFVMTRTLERVLFETSPTDPAAFVFAIAGLILAVLAASYEPARHASLTNPVEVLRSD